MERSCFTLDPGAIRRNAAVLPRSAEQRDLVLYLPDELLIVDSVYRPARRFCDNVLARLGVTVTYYDPLIGTGIDQFPLELIGPDRILTNSRGLSAVPISGSAL